MLDVSLFDALAEWMGYPAYYTSYGGTPPPRSGASHAVDRTVRPVPGRRRQAGLPRRSRTSASGRRFCAIVLQRPELATDARFDVERPTRRPPRGLHAAIDDVFAPSDAPTRSSHGSTQPGSPTRAHEHVEEFVRSSATGRPRPLARGRSRRPARSARSSRRSIFDGVRLRRWDPIPAIGAAHRRDPGRTRVLTRSRATARGCRCGRRGSHVATRAIAWHLENIDRPNGTTEDVTIKEGWTGRFYEDFEVGDVYQHPLGRTVTTTDNIWFTLLTQNTAPIHFDHHYAAQTEFGKPLVDSTFTLALVTGQSVTDISQNVMANLAGTRCACRPRSSRATRSTRSRRCWRCASRSRARTSASSRSRRPATTRTARSSSRSSARSWSTSAGRRPMIPRLGPAEE